MNIKSAERTASAAAKATQATSAAQKSALAAAKTSKRTAQAAQTAAKRTAEAIKAAAKGTVSAVKGIIAGTKALVSALLAGGWISVMIILIVVLLGCAVALFGGGSSNSYTSVSAEVEAYEPLIRQYASQYGIPEYVELIKAVMMQESGGRGLDPIQAAEGSFNTRYPHEPNGIQDPEYSIQCGVQELKTALISAKVENPVDMERIKLALQGYNFGNGYISWAVSNYGGYSYANAVEFSARQAERLGWRWYFRSCWNRGEVRKRRGLYRGGQLRRCLPWKTVFCGKRFYSWLWCADLLKKRGLEFNQASHYIYFFVLDILINENII